MPEPAPKGTKIAGEHNQKADPGPRRHSLPISNAVWIPLSLLGATLLSVANGTADPFPVVFFFFVVGTIVNILCFGRRAQQERHAFVLSYSTCVFIAGLSQLYMKTYFDAPIGVTDAADFYGRLFQEPPYYSLNELATIWIGGSYLGKGAPLSIYMWQRLYHAGSALGLEFGPYLGVLFNAFTVGLTASITTNTARFLFGKDERRLRRVAMYCALCGMFWLFGAILLRDCFTLFFNALTLWALVRLLCKPKLTNLLLAGVIITLSCLAILYLRKRSIILFGLFGALAFSCWYLRGKRSQARTFATLLLPLFALWGSSYVYEYIQTSSSYTLHAQESYMGYMADSSRSDSLGLTLVVNQPLPIRAVLGTGVMLVYPIPLWSYLKAGVTEYQLIKTWQGIYLVCLLPFVFVAMLSVIREFIQRKADISPRLFLVLYAVSATVVVAISSMETRHLGQFMPAFILLAAIPDTRIRRVRIETGKVAFVWFIVVAFVHIAWATMRFI